MLPKCDVFRVVFLSPQLPHDCFSLSSLELGIFMRQNQRWFQWGALGPVVFEIAKNLLCRGTGGQVCRKFLKISCGVIGTGAGGVTQMDRAQRDMPCGRAAPGSAAVEGAVMGGSAPSGPTGCPGRTCGPGELTAWPEAPGQPPDRQGPQLLGWMQCGGAWSPPRGTALRRRKGGRSRHIPETPEGKKWGGWECYSLPEGPSETRGGTREGAAQAPAQLGTSTPTCVLARWGYAHLLRGPALGAPAPALRHPPTCSNAGRGTEDRRLQLSPPPGQGPDPWKQLGILGR